MRYLVLLCLLSISCISYGEQLHESSKGLHGRSTGHPATPAKKPVEARELVDVLHNALERSMTESKTRELYENDIKQLEKELRGMKEDAPDYLEKSLEVTLLRDLIKKMDEAKTTRLAREEAANGKKFADRIQQGDLLGKAKEIQLKESIEKQIEKLSREMNQLERNSAARREKSEELNRWRDTLHKLEAIRVLVQSPEQKAKMMAELKKQEHLQTLEQEDDEASRHFQEVLKQMQKNPDGGRMGSPRLEPLGGRRIGPLVPPSRLEPKSGI